MTSSDQPAAGPALPDRARTVRWGFHAVRLVIVTVLLAAAAVLPTGQGALDKLLRAIPAIVADQVKKELEPRLHQ